MSGRVRNASRIGDDDLIAGSNGRARDLAADLSGADDTDGAHLSFLVFKCSIYYINI